MQGTYRAEHYWTCPLSLLDRLADLVPPQRKHRHRYHGVFAPNHPLRRTVTALAIGNIGKQSDSHATVGHAAGDCYDSGGKPRSHDTSRIAWAKLITRRGEEFPLLCPNGVGDIRLKAFINDDTPSRKMCVPVESPVVSPDLACRPSGATSHNPMTTGTSFRSCLVNCDASGCSRTRSGGSAVSDEGFFWCLRLHVDSTDILRGREKLSDLPLLTGSAGTEGEA